MRHSSFLLLPTAARGALGAAAAAIALATPGAHAQWFDDGTAISTAVFRQESPAIANDDAGGAIIAWIDQRDGDWNVYAQRVSAWGALLWNPDGVPVATAIGDQTDVAIAADGSGGAVMVWADDQQGVSNLDLYAQRVSATGTLSWGAGVPVSTFIGSQRKPIIVPDDEGGAIIAWEDLRGGNADIYAQRVNFLGTRVWTLNGNAVATDPTEQSDVDMIPDGIGGMIVAWEDFRDGTDGEIYTQRLNSAGDALWEAGGRAVTSGADVSGMFGDPVLASDDQSGAIVAWHEGVTGELRARRVDFFGNVLWTAGGVAIGSHLLGGGHAVVADGAGGVIVAWEKQVTLTNHEVFAQRLDIQGAKQWGMDGVNVSDAPGNQRIPAMTGDGQHGAVIVWNYYDTTTNDDLYAQHIDATGAPLWASGGQVVSNAAGYQTSHVLVSAGHAIVAWTDGRSGGLENDIYALRLNAPATGVGAGTPSLTSLRLLPNVPNPFAAGTTLRVGLLESADLSVEVFDVSGRRVYVERWAGLSPGWHAIPFSASRAGRPALPSGVYLYRVTAGGESLTRKMVITR